MGVDVLGVRISAINMASAIETIRGWVEASERQYVCVTGVHGVMESQRDAQLRDIHNSAGLTTPDGMPMVWAGRRAGADWMERVYGPDLMLEVCRLSADFGWSSFFYGAAEGVPELLANRLKQRFPGLQVSGCYSPPFRPLTEDEKLRIADMINLAAPTFVWVGLSTPKQERWMSEFRRLLDAPVLFGVGAAFDMHAGLLPQAPRWLANHGLEWAYRLYREPGRLWKRYLTNNPEFVVSILRRPPRLIQ